MWSMKGLLELIYDGKTYGTKDQIRAMVEVAIHLKLRPLNTGYSQVRGKCFSFFFHLLLSNIYCYPFDKEKKSCLFTAALRPPRSYKGYRPEDMREAILTVESEAMTVPEAATQYGIPARTLYSKTTKRIMKTRMPR